VIGAGDGNGDAVNHAFPASRAWLYVAIVGVGYVVSRGLAKSGSREDYPPDGNRRRRALVSDSRPKVRTARL